jgi:N-acetylneuraminic acid mutarotase
MFSRISKLFIIFVMLIAIFAVHQVEAGTWTQKADMPTARHWCGTAVVDGKIYVIGGDAGPEWSMTAVAEEYDPAADTWTTRANMPSVRHALGAAAVDEIVYAIGGWGGGDQHSTVEAYDPATDKWAKKASMPAKRTGLSSSVVAVDEKIYVISGLGPGTGIFSIVMVYDPATDKWTRKANIPTARMDHAACVIDGRIYVSGGSLAWPRTPTTSIVEVYDPATDTWARVSDMPHPRQRHSASAVDGKMYIIGGQDDAVLKLFDEGKLEENELGELFSIVDVYDPTTDTWTTSVSHPFVTTGHAAAVVDGKIYTMSGRRGNEIYSTVYEFDPGLPEALTSVSPGGKMLETWGHVKNIQ